MRTIVSAALATALVSFLVWPAPHAALAAMPDRHETQGARIRLLAVAPAEAGAGLRGALEIRLKPGWKTYWIDPGDSGVPPSLDILGEETAGAQLHFPAPLRFDDGYSVWAGYDRSVVLPFTLDADTSGPIRARVFLGICETICVPVQAQLEFDPAAAARGGADEAAVAAAFASLPAPESPQLRARAAGFDGEALEVEILAPAGTEIVDLFVAGNAAARLGTPRREERGGATFFRVPVLAPSERAPAEPFFYTLVTGDGAVSGTLAMVPARD